MPRSIASTAIGHSTVDDNGEAEDDDLRLPDEGSQSTYTDEDCERLEQEVTHWKYKCRELESENVCLRKIIPQLKDAQGKDCTKMACEMAMSLQREKEQHEGAETNYHHLMAEFAKFKRDTEEQNKVMVDKLAYFKHAAVKLDDENAQLRHILAVNEIKFHIIDEENGLLHPDSDVEQQQECHQYMNVENVDVESPRSPHQLGCSVSQPMLLGPSCWMTNNKNPGRIGRRQKKKKSAVPGFVCWAMVFALIILIVVVAILVFVSVPQ